MRKVILNKSTIDELLSATRRMCYYEVYLICERVALKEIMCKRHEPYIMWGVCDTLYDLAKIASRYHWSNEHFYNEIENAGFKIEVE